MESVIDAVTKAEGAKAVENDIFRDRRSLDRRRQQVECLIPRGKCRRADPRRCSNREFSSKPWWLHIEYVVEKPLGRRNSQLNSVK